MDKSRLVGVILSLCIFLNPKNDTSKEVVTEAEQAMQAAAPETAAQATVQLLVRHLDLATWQSQQNY